MVKYSQSCLILALAVLVIAGCQSPNPTVSPFISQVRPQASPLSTPEWTLATPGGNFPEGPLFTINLPVKAGDTIVRGTGGPGVPIRVVNLTQMASELGQGQVGPDGKYAIQIPSGLPKGERIALMIGDLTGTHFQPTDFRRGPGYTDVPFIGTVFTSTLVSP